MVSEIHPTGMRLPGAIATPADLLWLKALLSRRRRASAHLIRTYVLKGWKSFSPATVLSRLAGSYPG